MIKIRYMCLLFVTVFFFLAPYISQGQDKQIFLAKYLEHPNGEKELLFKGFVPWRSDIFIKSQYRENIHPQYYLEGKPLGPERIIEISSPNKDLVYDILLSRGVEIKDGDDDEDNVTEENQGDEVFTLKASGPTKNRIDFTFMGDGYTTKEKDKFLADMKRLTHEMFVGQTFGSFLPLFNIYAVFRPSKESGIGIGSPKNTAYGLYRDGNTLRAIYLSNSSAATQSCHSAPDCDYPIVIGNDPYYGGLGGEYAISTSSETSGTVVLRHELGHTIGDIGDEYDESGFFGANYAESLDSLGWTHWLTSPPVVAEPVNALYIAWPWYNLSQGGFTASFESDGKYASRLIRFSGSGLNDQDPLKVTLDGTNLFFTPPSIPDRIFYDFSLAGGFSAGEHNLVFKQGTADGNNWVSSLTIHEYGEGFHSDKNFIGAFPMFSSPGSSSGYRPTNESCLMRNMKSTHFCAVDQENLWLKMLARISIIDDVIVTPAENSQVKVEVKVPPLGQFRLGYLIPDEKLLVSWYKNGKLMSDLNNKFSFTMPKNLAQADWEVKVKFVTPEVRKDSEGLLTATKEFKI